MILFVLFAGTDFKQRIMEILVIALIILIVNVVCFFTWFLCAAASEADRGVEMLDKSNKGEE